jgi:hypothetical protein
MGVEDRLAGDEGVVHVAEAVVEAAAPVERVAAASVAGVARGVELDMARRP